MATHVAKIIGVHKALVISITYIILLAIIIVAVIMLLFLNQAGYLEEVGSAIGSLLRLP